MSTTTTLTGTTARQVPAQHHAARHPARHPARADRGAPARGTRTSDLRLTRRGRVVVALFLLALVLGAVVLLGGTSVATGAPGAEVPTRTVVVGEGDTLWEIAGEVAAPGEVREMVHRIEKLNSLPGPALEVGQELAVPVE